MTAELKPYPTMKDSGVKWLGMVPEHWEVMQFRSLGTGFNNGTATDQLVSGESDYLVSRIETISKGVIDYSKVGYIPNDSLVQAHYLKRDDFLISHINSYARVGNSARYDGDRPLLHGMNLIRVTPRDCVDPHFLGFLLKSQVFIGSMQRACKPAINQVSVTTVAMKAIRLPIPPLPEQVAIARYLDYVDSRVRRLTEAKRKLIGLLTEYKQAIIHRAVTRGLDPNVPLKDSGIEWLGMVPQHWEVRRFKTEVANIVDQTDRRDEDDEYIALEHVESWTGKIYPAPPDILFDSQVKKFEPGDVLFGKLRPYLAKVARPKRKGVCVSEFFVFRPRNGKLSAGYLEQFLRSSSVIGCYQLIYFRS